MKEERWTDALAPTATKVMLGMVLGAALAVGYATIADTANSARIDSITSDTAVWRQGISDRLYGIEQQIAILSDRQIRIQEDVAEIKRAQKGGGEPSE